MSSSDDSDSDSDSNLLGHLIFLFSWGPVSTFIATTLAFSNFVSPRFSHFACCWRFFSSALACLIRFRSSFSSSSLHFASSFSLIKFWNSFDEMHLSIFNMQTPSLLLFYHRHCQQFINNF